MKSIQQYHHWSLIRILWTKETTVSSWSYIYLFAGTFHRWDKPVLVTALSMWKVVKIPRHTVSPGLPLENKTIYMFWGFNSIMITGISWKLPSWWSVALYPKNITLDYFPFKINLLQRLFLPISVRHFNVTFLNIGTFRNWKERKTTMTINSWRFKQILFLFTYLFILFIFLFLHILCITFCSILRFPMSEKKCMEINILYLIYYYVNTWNMWNMTIISSSVKL